MLETNPFGCFVPPDASSLVLGSFPGRHAFDPAPNNPYNWFYCSSRNQFWPIIENVYGVKLGTKDQKQKLFENLGIAITDIILKCERRDNNNMDNNLINIVYNTRAIENIFATSSIKRVFFTSILVEKIYRREFKMIIDGYPKVDLVTLPSPSPRYARMSIGEKVEKYRRLLPNLAT